MNKGYCIACRYKDTDTCIKCKENNAYNDNFEPIPEAKEYFGKYFITYDRPNEWGYKSTANYKLTTHTIQIKYNHYCAYCSNEAFPLQIPDVRDLPIVGYRCFCNGAIKELEYRERKKELLAKHEKELRDLNNEYADSLTIDAKNLFEIHQAAERKYFESHLPDYKYFSTINGVEMHNCDNETNILFDR